MYQERLKNSPTTQMYAEILPTTRDGKLLSFIQNTINALHIPPTRSNLDLLLSVLPYKSQLNMS